MIRYISLLLFIGITIKEIK